MTKEEFLQLINITEIDEEKIKKVESIYGKFDNMFVKKLLSIKLETYFIESEDILRFLTTNEILSAPEKLNSELKNEKIIPLFDVGDNDFIVYHLDSKKWSLMNIITGVCFSETLEINDLLE